MRVFFVLLVTTLYILLFSSPVLAQVVINEISPASDPEWVELYNPFEISINLEGWEVADDETGTGHFYVTITKSNQDPVIPAYGFLIVEAPSGNLANASDQVSLYDASNNLVDDYLYNGGKTGKTFSRIPDGSGEFVLTAASKGTNNQEPTQKPISTPTPTSSQEPNPTTTPTSQVTNTLTPSIKKTSTPTETATITASETEYPTLILGESTTPTPEEQSEPPTPDQKQPLLPLIITATGILVLASTAGFFAYRHYYTSKRSKIPTSDS